MSDRPKQEDLLEGWVTKDCNCGDLLRFCDRCDGSGWVYHNTFTGGELSDLMLSATERHF